MTHQYAHLPSNSCADDDEGLVKRFLDGQRDAGDELFRRHWSLAYGVAYRLLGNDADAEDAVQRGFLNACAAIKGFNGHSSFRAWLLRVVSNAALEIGRELARLHRLLTRPESGRPVAVETGVSEEELLGKELRQVIGRILSSPSERLRQVFWMHAEGLTHAQIAELLGVSEGAARWYWKKVRTRVAVELCRMGYSSP